MTIVSIVAVISLTIFLLVASYIFRFVDAKLGFRSQHRQGPNRSSSLGWAQQFIDATKFWRKGSIGKNRSILLYFGVLLFLLLPFVFFVLLLFPEIFGAKNQGGFFLLFLIISFSIALDSLFLYALNDSESKMLAKRNLLLRYLGITILLLSCLPTLIYYGPNIIEGRPEIDRFGYFMFRNPFALLAGLCGFLSIFYLLPSRPFGQPIDDVFSGYIHFTYDAAKNIWTVAFYSFWVAIFLGGWVGIGVDLIGFLGFFPQLIVVLIGYLWVQKSLPALRAMDSINFGVTRILPIACIATIGEILWIAILG